MNTIPIYEFECEHGHKFEKLVPMDTKEAACSECGMSSDPRPFMAKKVLSVPAPAHFSGHGWTPKRLERRQS